MSTQDPGDELLQLRQRYARLQLLHQIGNVIHSTLDPQEALQLILRETLTALGASSGSVVLINPTTGFLEIQGSSGLPIHAGSLRLRVGEGITGWVARHGKPARVGDVTKDPRYIMLRRHVRSEMAVPLEVNGDLRGVLNVDSDRLDAFSAEDQQFLESLAVLAAQAIRNTWLYAQLALKARLFESLINVAQAINTALDLGDALRAITHQSSLLMEAKVGSIFLIDDKREFLVLHASHGAGPAYTAKSHVALAESFLGSVVRRAKPLQLDNVQATGRYQNVEVARVEGLVSLLSVPLLYGGSTIGVLNIYKGHPHSFSNEEIRILCALAELSAVAIQKARLYERLVDVEDHLRQTEKLSALGLLAAEVAHEIRNPLTVMKMLYHSLDLHFPPGDPRTRDVQIMGEKMDHLNKIVEQVLDFARTSEPVLAPVSVNQLIDDLRLLTRHKLRNQQVELVQKLDPSLPLLRADATQLEQVFLNLTLNAAQAMPQGGRLTVTTRAVRQPRTAAEPTHVQVEFSDTGVGMSPEQCDKAFTSLLSTSKAGGTGLGLAIVARVVEIHRGKVTVKSALGRGTTFTLTLPL